jgi:hypothetical protein
MVDAPGKLIKSVNIYYKKLNFILFVDKWIT